MEIRHILKPVTKDSIDLVIHNPDGYDERVDEAISTINDLLLGNKKNIKSRLPFHISFNPGLKNIKLNKLLIFTIASIYQFIITMNMMMIVHLKLLLNSVKILNKGLFYYPNFKIK